MTKQKVDITLKGGDSLPEADFHRRPVKFMYADASDMHFLDQEDFNQYSLPLGDIEEEAKYLTDRLEGVQILIYNEQAVGLQIPQTIELVISECDPSVKGNSATGRTKPATLETGLIVQVPEYLSTGETIKVDARTGEFLSRAIGAAKIGGGARSLPATVPAPLRTVAAWSRRPVPRLASSDRARPRP